MRLCPTCDRPLNISQDLELDGICYKSCPKCSIEHGVHVFYKTEVFGCRDMGDGRHIVQSWCSSCRSGENPSIPEVFRCK